MIQFLRDFEAEYRSATELLRELRMRLAEEWAAFTGALNLTAAGIAGDEPLLRLKNSLDTFAKDLEQTASNPEPAANGLQQRLADLQERWREVILRQLESVPEATRVDIENLLRHQDFVGAAEHIVAELAAARGNAALGEEEEREALHEQGTPS